MVWVQILLPGSNSVPTSVDFRVQNFVPSSDIGSVRYGAWTSDADVDFVDRFLTRDSGGMNQWKVHDQVPQGN